MGSAAQSDSCGHRRAPSVLIEDPTRESAYYVPASEIDAFRVDAHVWPKVDGSTVAFNVPGEGLVDALPPYIQKADSNPSILIRNAAGRVAYFLMYDQLQAFKVTRPARSQDDDIVRFIIPRI